ncbi:hypothetical protein ACIBFB_19460 [Nocardiopsis sp. NPDC050513]|uniref:hypothetical protein n=1 Tax=Nocardiopsis sp. NPDC050513 TaxID=3364338 RepID=UPI0037A1A335
MNATNIVLGALVGTSAALLVVASSTWRVAPVPFLAYVAVLAVMAGLLWACRGEIREELGDTALRGAVAVLPLFSSVAILTILDLVGTACCAGGGGPGHPCLCGLLGGDGFHRVLGVMFPTLATDPRLPHLAVVVALNAIALTTAFMFLRGVAHIFGQRGLRLSALAMAATAVIWVAWIRFPESIEQFPDWPDPIRGGWTAALLILLGGGYLWLETTAVRREPSVNISEPREQDDEATTRLNQEVRWRLPAIEVLAPAWKPGAPPGHAVAAMVESSDIEGSRIAAALMRVLALVLPVPPSYGVRVRADGQAGDGPGAGEYVSATVDIHDRISGKSLHQTTLPPLRTDLAAIRAAGFVASRVFADNPLIPAWAKGSYEGEDLAAYLMIRELPRLDSGSWERSSDALVDADGDYDAFHAMQRERIAILRPAADSRRVSGIVRYELASLYEQEGQHVKALRLHALNRAHYASATGPNRMFQRSRYRMIVLLKMIANHRFEEVWSQADERDLRDVYHALNLAGLLSMLREDRPGEFDGLREEEFAAPRESGDGFRRVRLALLHTARLEADALDRYFSRRRMVCDDIRWRGRNPYSVLPPGITSQESPWRRRMYYDIGFRLLHSSIASRIASAEGGADHHEKRWRQRHRQEHELRRLEKEIDDFRELNPGWGLWGITYNKASLIATQKLESGIPLSPKERADAVDEVITTLREALNPSACEHYRPSELLALDPDLECMQREQGFIALLREQYDRDWQVKPDFWNALGAKLAARPTSGVPPPRPGDDRTPSSAHGGPDGDRRPT